MRHIKTRLLLHYSTLLGDLDVQIHLKCGSIITEAQLTSGQYAMYSREE